MIVTTSYEPDQEMILRAINIARQVGGQFIERGKFSLLELNKSYNTRETIVIEKELTKYYSTETENPFFFHPSMATLRINRLKQGDNDIMVDISKLKLGDTFLDCTLGFASDSIVASFVVGSTGKVVGIESQPIISAIVQDGLNQGWPKDKDIDQAMKRIEVLTKHYLPTLKIFPSKSFDVVYFDPMFRQGQRKSSSMNPLRKLANAEPIQVEAIEEAKRVAKRMVILKEHIYSREFERLGFTPIHRSSSITYGIINVNGDEQK
ncbi:class I SAM-dependent methyltransferase [Tepidibacillus infernus]|uniref:SAM-dependent methyltransferase n=1 Tax=Tepidibacillus decaturensis TaxID=1413211 RepID=A0A135L3A4_9BACI|nr:class I SAM-dependent methyltransferase [Tepidibacillus decaturensis]KXG43476.1 hypothetical protein U473_05200 [Tepidibacillus decaturensis]